MGQIAVIAMDRSAAGQVQLADALTEAPYHPFLIRDAVAYHRARLQQGTHATRTRSMVSGSTRKLFRQKGTGSARAGDRKPPQRRGGGVAHGPKPRSHAIGMNKRMRKQALCSAIAEKLRRGQLLVLEALVPETPKTKAMAAWLKQMEAPQALIVTHELAPNLVRATRNLPDVELVHFGKLTVYHLLRFEKALVTRQALLALQERLTA